MNLDEYARKAQEDQELFRTQQAMNEKDRRRRQQEELVDVAREHFMETDLANGTLIPEDLTSWVCISVSTTTGITLTVEGIQDDGSMIKSYQEALGKEALVSVWLESKSHKYFAHIIQKDDDGEWVDYGVFQPGETSERNIVQMNALSFVRRNKIESLSDIS